MEQNEIDRKTLGLIALVSLFVASLTASNFLAAKLFEYHIGSIVLAAPAAVAAYALTFTFTDIISEVYGRKAANLAVRLGFATQLVVLLYIVIAIKLQISEHSMVSQEIYESVIGSNVSIILASLIAYLISQHHDVWAFHLWKVKTNGKWLWLRNNASTMVSQLIDTAIFITLAFHVLPQLLGDLSPLPLSVVETIIVGQYLVKLLIAILDTPLVYLGVALVRKYTGLEPVYEKVKLTGKTGIIE